jgi:hypothetical protein
MEAYKMFQSKNLNKAVAANLIRMFDALGLTMEDFDDRAVEMLATFPVEQANYIVRELRVSCLPIDLFEEMLTFCRTRASMECRTSHST